MAGENLSGGSDDFVVTSSGSPSFTAVEAPPATPPAEPPAPPAEPPPATPESPPPATEEAPVEAPPAEGEPAATVTAQEAAAAAVALPKGDSKAGKTLSDRGRMIQAEINALTAQKYQTRSETEAARAELAELRAERQRIYSELQARQPAQPGQPAQPAQPGQPAAAAEPPKEENFNTFGEFVTATAKYWHDEGQRAANAHAQQLIEQTLAQERQRYQQEQENRQLTEIFNKHHQNVEAARAAHPDFDEVVAGSALPTNPMMEAHIPRSPISGELLHYLATHPDETVQIAQMSAGPTLVALGRLEARIEAAKSGPAPVRPQLVSKAKPPIKPVGASSGTTADEVPTENASLDEHVAFWNRKDRERRGGRR
jgi:hypothetical protein